MTDGERKNGPVFGLPCKPRSAFNHFDIARFRYCPFNPISRIPIPRKCIAIQTTPRNILLPLQCQIHMDMRISVQLYL